MNIVFNHDEMEYILHCIKKDIEENKNIRKDALQSRAKVSVYNKCKQYQEKWINTDENQRVPNLITFMDVASHFSTKDYIFDLDRCTNDVEVSGGLIDEFIRVGSIEELNEYLDDIASSDTSLDNNLRFCSICGSPMQDGFTNEEEYICSYMEFVNFMNKTYGEENWREATISEHKLHDANYMYYDSESSTWEPSPWYWTEYE